MKITNLCRLAMAWAVLLGFAAAARAQAPPSSPRTLWQFLGIPQNVHKLQDSLLNRKGNHPNFERKPPLKKLADAANLESDVPAIKKAAEIKMQEDLKDQKIKGIKYLSEVGCGCYEGVKEALLAALDDCTEEVRYEAAIAFCKASGNPCTLCNPNTCCDDDVIEKLNDIAFGQDANGCYNEPSPRVRAAARLAMTACEQVVVPAPPKEIKELPVEAPVKETPEPIFRERGVEEETPAEPSEEEMSLIVDPVSMSRSADVWEEAGDEAVLQPDVDALAMCPTDRWVDCCPRPCWPRVRRGRPCAPSMPTEPGVVIEEPIEAPARPEELPGEAFAEEPLAPPPTALAGTFGMLPAPQSAAPYMIGDLFGYGSTRLAMVFRFPDVNRPFIFSQEIPNPGGGGVVGKMKIAEDTSPMPRDRLIFDYSYFDNVPLYPGGVDVNRFTLGFEKTFFDGLTSFELKAPMAVTLDSDIFLGGPNDLWDGEFGNMGLTFKGLLIRRRTLAISGGMSVWVPTADPTRVKLPLITPQRQIVGGIPLVEIENESVHLGPFFGLLWTPNDRFFAQAFLQYDVDANGNPVFINTGDGLVESGRLNDVAFQYLDVGIGRWMYRSRDPWARLQGVAWTAELHWNRSLQDPDLVLSEGFEPDGTLRSIAVGSVLNNVDQVNGVLGLHAELGTTLITLGCAAPMGGSDQEFDFEVRLMINRHFGPQTRATRVPL